MHIATRPVAAQPYPLALKHYDLLNKNIKNLLDGGIICKSMSPWASPIVVMIKHTPEGLPTAVPLVHRLKEVELLTTGSNTSNGYLERCFHTYAPAENWWILYIIKRSKVPHSTYLCSGYYHIKLDEDSIPKSASTTVFGKFKFLRLPLACLQAQTSLFILFTFLVLTRPLIKVKALDIWYI